MHSIHYQYIVSVPSVGTLLNSVTPNIYLSAVAGAINMHKKRKLAAYLGTSLLLERSYRKRTCWKSTFLELHDEHGFYNALLPGLEDLRYFNYFRMTRTKFEELFNIVGPDIIKHSRSRNAIEAAERLCPP